LTVGVDTSSENAPADARAYRDMMSLLHEIFLCRGQLDEIAKRGQSVVIKKRGGYASYCSKILWKFVLERFPYLIGNLPYTCQLRPTGEVLLDTILLELPAQGVRSREVPIGVVQLQIDMCPAILVTHRENQVPSC
jgi:hypothetical protein